MSSVQSSETQSVAASSAVVPVSSQTVRGGAPEPQFTQGPRGNAATRAAAQVVARPVEFPAIKGDDGRADPTVHLRPMTHAAAVVVPQGDLPAVSVSDGVPDLLQTQRPGAVGAPVKEQKMRAEVMKPMAQVSVVGHGPIVRSAGAAQYPEVTPPIDAPSTPMEANRPGALQAAQQTPQSHVTRDHTYVDMGAEPTLPEFLRGGAATPPYVPVVHQPVQRVPHSESVLVPVLNQDPTYDGGTLPEVVVTPQYMATYAEVQASLLAVQSGLAFAQHFGSYIINPYGDPYGGPGMPPLSGYAREMQDRMLRMSEQLGSYYLGADMRQAYIQELSAWVSGASILSNLVTGARNEKARGLMASIQEVNPEEGNVEQLNDDRVAIERRVAEQKYAARVAEQRAIQLTRFEEADVKGTA